MTTTAPERGPIEHADLDGAALLQQVRLSTHRLLGATMRLGDVELLLPAASGLGTRRHVVARLVRHARRVTASPDDPARGLASDSLLKAPAADLVDALATTLTTVVRRLDDDPAARIPADDGDELCARDHLAWLELTHVDLGVGFEMHDIPEAALPAITAHLERWTAPDANGTVAGNSPFALLFARDERPRR
ncbi:hypothetical protein [Agrococcus sp. SGAir0287]|uniref:hypothetical protein n=1 Tax=Agrococcus sp. SGAir0287 TaxID=2070347 RepID=UPI0010CCECBC|nr:hypothetical protein [Agrococcus sp. SGAir0287]QCR18059.1 hypothetical protein C1N71_00205 [Agrococcus sp. SGAir0287]